MGKNDKQDNHEQEEHLDNAELEEQDERLSADESAENISEEELQSQRYNELNDKYLRLYSDFDNYRKRTIKEKSELISSAGAGVMKDMLSVLDDFERAIASNEKTQDPEVLKEGFQLIYNKFKNILTAKGLQPMDSFGKPFDLDHHEAITNIPAPSEEQKGKVVDVLEKGYFLNDKVLRYAKVVVGK
ncbi:MAG: nucleotide exchange factor GrpE [Brumimicrobium sp.]|nr:nucleotide exchange factor GrpE [Brumimicrobium sp.]